MRDDTFIPRIQSIFYAEFDVVEGICVRYQVPEDLIRRQDITTSSNGAESPPEAFHETNGGKSNGRELLFPFEIISQFVIPKSAFCGRLVVCTTPKHRVMGFPIVLQGRRYKRRKFRYNICFVFQQDTDPTCYEPIVRKVARVLTHCELEGAFLSSPETSCKIPGILEQIFEDLNSYAETSIRIDPLNSLELKIFPYYPNPPKVTDWDVPVPLINLGRKIERNWDVTITKALSHVNGINHIRRISNRAEVDIALVRQSISHLLLYQCIMLIDIFQFANIYCLSQPIAWLARNENIAEECGAYATKTGFPIPPWSTLLWLYSRLKPPKSVGEWMAEFGVNNMGLDVRRFLTFAVIKGFIRRVHRWPILLPKDQTQIPITRKRSKSLPSPHPLSGKPDHPIWLDYPSPFQPSFKPSDHGFPPFSASAAFHDPRAFPQFPDQLVSVSPLEHFIPVPPPSPVAISRRFSQAFDSHRSSVSYSETVVDSPISRVPLSEAAHIVGAKLSSFEYPPELPVLLNGSLHTDALCTMFEVGWEQMERYLTIINQRCGPVVLVYR